MKGSFLNSIWLVSSVKEWIMRSFGMGNFTILLMFGLDFSRNGVTQTVISTLVLSFLIINILSACLIGTLYRKYLKGELTNKEYLFKAHL